MRHSKPARLGNHTYRIGLNSVRSDTAPTGCKSVNLFLEITKLYLRYQIIEGEKQNA